MANIDVTDIYPVTRHYTTVGALRHKLAAFNDDFRVIIYETRDGVVFGGEPAHVQLDTYLENDPAIGGARPKRCVAIILNNQMMPVLTDV